MSLESAYVRKEKRIVEHIIGGFKSAKDAIIFGNTVEAVIQENVKEFIKFRQQIGSPDTKLVITKDWEGETVLKTAFLDIPNQNTAVFVCDVVKKATLKHKEVHDCTLNIINEIVRDKPQPQFIG